MRKAKLFTLIIVVAMIVTSCSVQRGWVWAYSPNSWAKGISIKKEVAVKTFIDSRGESKNKNLIRLSMIPGMPFGWSKMNVPETNKKVFSIYYNPKEDFAKALVQELTTSAIFKDAFFEDKPTSDYYIEGKIIKTLDKGKMFTYCISGASFYLWVLGAPVGSLSNELSLEMTCYNKNNEVLFQKIYNKKYRKTYWMYTIPMDYKYPDLLKEIYFDFIQDLKNSKLNN